MIQNSCSMYMGEIHPPSLCRIQDQWMDNIAVFHPRENDTYLSLSRRLTQCILNFFGDNIFISRLTRRFICAVNWWFGRCKIAVEWRTTNRTFHRWHSCRMICARTVSIQVVSDRWYWSRWYGEMVCDGWNGNCCIIYLDIGPSKYVSIVPSGGFIAFMCGSSPQLFIVSPSSNFGLNTSDLAFGLPTWIFRWISLIYLRNK